MITLVIESIEKQKILPCSGITFLGTADYYGEKSVPIEIREGQIFV